MRASLAGHADRMDRPIPCMQVRRTGRMLRMDQADLMEPALLRFRMDPPGRTVALMVLAGHQDSWILTALKAQAADHWDRSCVRSGMLGALSGTLGSPRDHTVHSDQPAVLPVTVRMGLTAAVAHGFLTVHTGRTVRTGRRAGKSAAAAKW